MKKLFLFLIIFLFFICLIPIPASAQTRQTNRPSSAFALAQMIQIIKHEIEVLQSLLFNLQARQEISAASYLAVNLSDGSFLLQKNINQSYPIASITKLMGAVIASEQIEKEKTITLTEKMLEPLGHSPSLFLGLNVSAKNLLKASLIQSTNDAAEALAHFLGKENFLTSMNQKAKELGMKNTVFYDVHGLNPNNRSTSADLAKLIAYVYKEHPQILEISKNNNLWLPNSEGRLLKFQNVNNFYPLSSFIGGKTGYLPQARQTLASVFQVNQEPVAVILLYSSNRQADVFSILNQLKK